MFNQARNTVKIKGSCIIFIDEIDAVGYRRKSFRNDMLQGNRESEMTLNQLLNEMDGFQENKNLIVIAATNLIDNIDDALLRPGRFDQKIEIEPPTPLERSRILKIHLSNKTNNLE